MSEDNWSEITALHAQLAEERARRIRTMQNLIVLGIVAAIAAGWIFNRVGWDKGINAGELYWQQRTIVTQQCVTKNSASYEAHYGRPIDDASLTGVTIACDNYAQTQVGTKPHAWPWE